MKLLIQLIIMQILGVFILYSLAESAPSPIVAHVLTSDLVQQMESQFPKNVTVSLTRVEQVKSYLCANCFDLKLTYSGISTLNGRPIKFDKFVRTKGLGAQQIQVSLIRP